VEPGPRILVGPRPVAAVVGVADSRLLLTVLAQNAIQAPVAGMIAAATAALVAAFVVATVSLDVGHVSRYASCDGSIVYML
jgi:hypothetical protein